MPAIAAYRGLLWGVAILLFAGIPDPASGAQADEKIQKKVEKVDAQFIKACTNLSKKFDSDKVPEAAHFFASCALGYGAKDESLTSLKNSWEISVFIGKQKGGQVLSDLEPISSQLRSLAQDYRGFRDALWTPGVRGNLSDSSKRTLREVGVKMELAQNAGEYIKTVQRFNALRQSMGLRPVFWDFDPSAKLIAAAWYMAQTGDYDDKPNKDANKEHVCYTPDVEDARKKTSRMPNLELSAYPEHLRHFALVREDLINPNARSILLAHWGKGFALQHLVLYSIPQMPYREDIPTPTARFRDETVVQKWDGWVDVEETVTIASKKVPFVRYPYDGESNAPRKCYGGEDGWKKSEYSFLEGAGAPIICRFFINSAPADVEVKLTLSDGKTVPHRLYLNGDSRVRLRDWATVLAIPDKPLEPGTKCSVTLKCVLEGTTIEKSWSFAVGSE